MLASGNEFKVLYTKSDQLLNKLDPLMQIADNPLDIILITEVIPKAQMNAIDKARLNVPTSDLRTVVVFQFMYQIC